MSYSQTEINYKTPKLNVYIGDLLDGELISQYADLSKLNYVYNSEHEVYTAKLKIDIENSIPQSDTFWFMLITTKNSAFYSWSILNADGEGL